MKLYLGIHLKMELSFIVREFCVISTKGGESGAGSKSWFSKGRVLTISGLRGIGKTTFFRSRHKT